MTVTALGTFVEQELQRLGLNQSELARELDVSHVTVGRIIRGETEEPELALLVRLSRVTQTDIGSIVRLIYPNAFVGASSIDILSARLKRLPDDKRQLIETIITSLAIENQDKPANRE